MKFTVQRDRENYIYYVNRNFKSILANLESLIFKIFFVGPNHGGASYTPIYNIKETVQTVSFIYRLSLEVPIVFSSC